MQLSRVLEMKPGIKNLARLLYGLLISAGIAGCASSQPMDKIMQITKAAGPISAETTSMVLIDSTAAIIEFDGTAVKWTGIGNAYYGTGVLIPSGTHTLTGYYNHILYQILKWRSTVTLNFEPGRFYLIYHSSVDYRVLLMKDITDDAYYAKVKAQMEKAIASEAQTSTPQNTNIQSALNKSAQTLMDSLNKVDNIAIVSISASDEDMATFVAEELEVILVNNKFSVVDRSSLDVIRQEQNFQYSGEVDDQEAISIGQFAGAKVVIVGSISGSGSFRRLRLRALNTQNAQIIGAASESF